MAVNRSKESQTPTTETKIEMKLNKIDLETLQEAFEEHNIQDREKFVEMLSLVLSKGTKEEYSDLFDKIDVTREGYVDWEKFASHMLLDFYEKEDKTKLSSLPQWKDLRTLMGPHKDVIQKQVLLKNLNRYLSMSKEGNIGLWGSDLRLQKNKKLFTESCKPQDLWVTDFVYMSNVNKVAVSFTSKEIDFYDVGVKLEFNCQIRLQNLKRIPLCMDFWCHPENAETVLAWGDAGGYINVLNWISPTSTLFERTTAKPSDKDENMTVVVLKDVIDECFRGCSYFDHKAHQDWIRKVSYLPNLECFVSCATNWNTSMVICWMEKHNPNSLDNTGSPENRGISRMSVFTVHQGINSFAYNEQLNLIATAGVNFHVCLWNPYVISKPNGLLRGHMASVTDVQFYKPKGLLFSFSKDKVLRIWDVQLQVCIQRLAGIFPKGQEIYSKLFFHEEKLRLFITFNASLTLLEMKLDSKDKIISHDKPLIGCLYNSLYNQVVTACQAGVVYCWMIDTGQRVKTIAETCTPGFELTCITQDSSQTRFFTGSTDGFVKIWDFNGHCYHTLVCAGGNPVDISQIVILKRCVIVFGFSKSIIAFSTSSLKEHKVEPTTWNGIQTHQDDILAGTAILPHALATGSYDGEIVIWNINSEQASRVLAQRSQQQMKHLRLMVDKSATMNKEKSDMSTNDKKEKRIPKIENSLKLYAEQENYFDFDKITEASRSPETEAADTLSDMADCMFNISRLMFLENRKKIKLGGGANLVSCGGNGIVRFWNFNEGWLIGEFIAHDNASNIIMNINFPEGNYMATGDVDGNVKIWDISTYCLNEKEFELLMAAPPLVSQWQCHFDEISGIAFCMRHERTLVITASADQSAALWELNGTLIGRFGQEVRWKLGNLVETVVGVAEETTQDVGITRKDSDLIKHDPNWTPDPTAIENPSSYRINVWSTTYLGKDYQELRMKKRERVQPSTIPDLPYLYGEKTGRPTFGPFYSLNISTFDDIEELEIPEFMDNPERFFTETDDYLKKAARVPLLNDTLKAAFDEKALFSKDGELSGKGKKGLEKLKNTGDNSQDNNVNKFKGSHLKPIRESLKPNQKLPPIVKS